MLWLNESVIVNVHQPPNATALVNTIHHTPLFNTRTFEARKLRIGFGGP